MTYPDDVDKVANLEAALHRVIAERDDLARWKAEALPVMDGLQELGRALGLPLGTRITGRVAVDAALDLRNERDAALAKVARVREYALERSLYGRFDRTVHSARIASDLLAILDGTR